MSNLLPVWMRREIEKAVESRGLAVIMEALAAAVHWTDPEAEEVLRLAVRLLRLQTAAKERV